MGAPRRALILVLTLITLCLGATVSVWADAPGVGSDAGTPATATTSMAPVYDGPAQHARTSQPSGTSSVVHAGGPCRYPEILQSLGLR